MRSHRAAGRERLLAEKEFSRYFKRACFFAVVVIFVKVALVGRWNKFLLVALSSPAFESLAVVNYPADSVIAPHKETGPALQDFGVRCQSPGVLVCEGFDSPAEFAAAKWPAAGLYPAWDGALRGTMDTTIKASGTGSLRFEIPSHSAANAAGSWQQPFEHNFGEGSTFYVQFRQRFSKEMLTNK